MNKNVYEKMGFIFNSGVNVNVVVASSWKQ